MSDKPGAAGIPDAVDPQAQQRAANEQEAEQEALDEETRRRLQADPGDPKDRLDEPERDRLMEQNQYRELHP